MHSPKSGDGSGQKSVSLEPFEARFATLNPREFGELIRTARPGIRALLRAHFGGEISDRDLVDIADQVFAKAWISRAQFRAAERKLWGWLWAIARNMAVDLQRESARRMESLHEQDVAALHKPRGGAVDSSNGPELIRRSELEEFVADYFLKLSARDQMIVSAALGERRGWTHEVGRELGMKPGAVRLRWLRIRRKLQEAIMARNLR